MPVGSRSRGAILLRRTYPLDSTPDFLKVERTISLSSPPSYLCYDSLLVAFLDG